MGVVLLAALLACGAVANAQMAVDPGAPVVPLSASQKLVDPQAWGRQHGRTEY
jgi:hypothetical protein